MPKDKLHRALLVAILAIFTLLGALYSVTVPIFEASDEVWHYPMVEVIARTGQLPVQPLTPGASSGPWRQEGSQPPLYYALSAALTFWIDTGDMDVVRDLNPHVKAGEVTPERNNVNLVVHRPAVEAFPWSGTVLAVHIVRLFSVVLGTWAVYLTWALLHELFPSSPWIALTAAAVHAFTPMYLFISSTVNNDNLIVPLATLALLLMVRRVRNAGGADNTHLPRTSLQAYLGLGAVLGMALLTKASGIALLALATGALVWEAWYLPERPLGRRMGFFAAHLAAMIIPAVAIAGWWFARNARLYGDWLGLNAFYAVLGTRDVPASLGQLWSERFAFAAGYWGNFGGLNVPMPAWTTTALNVTAVIAAAGLLYAFVRWLAKPRTPPAGGIAGAVAQRLWPFAWDHPTAARALAWAWPAAVLVSWARWATVTWSSQGRLIFSALPMWSAGLVIGLSAWIPRSGKNARARETQPSGTALAGGALASVLLILSIAALPLWIAPAYRPPVPTAASPEDLGLTPLDAAFGDVLHLTGYRVKHNEVLPGEAVTLELMWQAMGPTQQHHSIYIHLLGEGDRIVAQRDTYPGGGLLPTTGLEPGHTWVERHVINLPPTAYAPDMLTMAVGVYETSTGARVAPAGTEEADAARFGEIALIQKEPAIDLNPVAVAFGEGIVLNGYDLNKLVVEPGDTVTVTLRWTCAAPIDEDYTFSVQLIDSRWHKAAQSDTPPLNGQAPTAGWQKGEVVEEARALAIAPETEPGSYDLRLTAYRVDASGTLHHLPVLLRKGTMPAQAVTLTTVRVQ